MFGLSWGQIIIIVLVGMFVLGPERIPVAVQWSIDGLKKLRTMAQGAQAQLQQEIGPELEELRRQVAELQSLKEVQELRNLRDLHPRKLLGNTLLGNDGASAGGIAGFLGLDPNLLGAPAAAEAGTDTATSNGAGPVNGTAASNGSSTSTGASAVNGENGVVGIPAAHEPAYVAAPPAAVPPPAPVVPLAPGEHPPFDPDGT